MLLINLVAWNGRRTAPEVMGGFDPFMVLVRSGEGGHFAESARPKIIYLNRSRQAPTKASNGRQVSTLCRLA